MSITEILSKIQQSLNCQKAQRNDFGKYSYRSCEDILQAVKPLLGTNTITINDEIVSVEGRVYVKATATFTVGAENMIDGPREISVSAYAREPLSRKGMDESQITGAASSYARKYALSGLLLIDDNKDADTLKQANEKEEYDNLVMANQDSVNAIKQGIADQDLSTASEAWSELSTEVKEGLWKAPTKGGCFSTEERKIMKTSEFREANL